MVSKIKKQRQVVWDMTSLREEISHLRETLASPSPSHNLHEINSLLQQAEMRYNKLRRNSLTVITGGKC